MSLTDKTCKLAGPKEKDYKLSDEKGMFLLVTASGSKYWRLKYRFAGKEKLLALGVYPEVPRAVTIGQVNVRAFTWSATSHSTPKESQENLVEQLRNWLIHVVKSVQPQ